MKYPIPHAREITRKNVSNMNATAWRQLAILAAGLPIEDLGGGVPDREDRQRAAEFIERALELWKANVLDAIRGTPWFGDVVSDRTSVEDFLKLEREGLRGLQEGMLEDVAEDAPEAIQEMKKAMTKLEAMEGGEAIPAMIELTRNIILAWEVAQFYREAERASGGAPEAITGEAFLDLWETTSFREKWQG